MKVVEVEVGDCSIKSKIIFLSYSKVLIHVLKDINDFSIHILAVRALNFLIFLKW